MMSNEDISERNKKLIKIVSSLNLGIHIINLPHKPIFLTHDYKKKINCYVHNYYIKLLTPEDSIFYEDKISEEMDVEMLRSKFVELIDIYVQQRVYILSHKGLFVTGFNHHNKIDKFSPYPVFAYYEPMIYTNIEAAQNTARKFKLDINE
jgi:hypothetical protein